MALRLNRQQLLAMLLTLFSVTMADLPIVCPQLSCNADFETMEDGICFQHDGGAPTELMTGRLCYDADTAPLSERPRLCPFDIKSYEWMWVEEFLQNQKVSNLSRHGKFLKAINLQKVLLIVISLI